MQPVTEAQLRASQTQIETEIIRLKTFILLGFYAFVAVEIAIAIVVVSALKP